MRRAILLLTIPLLAFGHRVCAAPLAVKTGKWSVTVTMQMDGTFLPPETLAKLPPAARAQMAGVITAMQQPKINHTCLTPRDLAEGFDFGKDDDDHCKMHVLQQTGAMLEMRGTCQDSGGASTAHAVFEAAGPETMHGEFDIDRQGLDRKTGTGTKRLKIQFAGTWTGPICTGHEDDFPAR